MPLTHPASRLLALLAFLVAFAAPLHGAGIVVTYQLAQGTAFFDPVTVPNPQGGPDLTITGSLELEAGSFEAVFENGLPAGSPVDAIIRNQNFEGAIAIEISTTIDLGIISPVVTATLAGPLTGNQVTDASGSILGDGTVFTNTTPGNFNVTAGPLACTSSFFNVLCPILETALGITFPVELPALDNAPLPFTGLFDGLETPDSSTASNTIEFSIPVADTNNFGLDADLVWTESGRLSIPEPSSSLLASLTLLVLARRRRGAQPGPQDLGLRAACCRFGCWQPAAGEAASIPGGDAF